MQSEIASETPASAPVKDLAVVDRPPSLSHLKQREAEFVYNVEVLGLPVVRAASLAGLDLSAAYKPHIAEARRLVKIELRGQSQFTREEVLAGIHDGIKQATLIAEPSTAIKGWEAIARIAGLEETKQLDVNIRASVEVMQKTVRALSDEAIMAALSDAHEIVDVDFYELKPSG